MTRDGNGMLRRQFGMLFDVGTVGDLTDRQLLERFRTRNGEAAEMAFAALVDRHGPMVFRVCQRALRDPHAAQDAFQATFLVLVRKAGTLWAHDSLGPWLHAVACRVSACARATEARRKAHERKLAETSPTTASTTPWDDLGQILHEEIERLPERFRAAVILCDLQGQTQEQAARLLGWPPGTVRSRLSRGRGRLQARLIRRGLAPSSGALAALVASESASAVVPASLAGSVVRTALLVAAGQWTTTGTVAISAALLTEGVLQAMFLTRLKAIAATLLLLGASTGGTAVLAYQDGGEPSTQTAGPSAPASTSKTTSDQPKPSKLVPPPRDEVRAVDAEESSRALYDALIAPPRDEVLVADAEVRMAEAELKRAEDRFEWAERMFEKGYLSRAALNAERGRLAAARIRLVAAKDRKQTLTEWLGGQRADTSQLEAKRLEAEIQAKQTEKAHAQKQLAETVIAINSRVRLIDKKREAASELELLKAEADLKFATARFTLCETEARELILQRRLVNQEPPEVALWNARLETARAALKMEKARLDSVVAELTVTALKKARNLGPDSDAEWERMIALVASTAADCDRKRTEVAALERRLKQRTSDHAR